MDKTAIQKLLEAGAAIDFQLINVPGSQKPIAIVPDSFGIESLAHYLDCPLANEGTAHLDTVTGLIEYFELFKEDHSVIFASLGDNSFTVIFDFSTKESPKWHRHKAVFNLRLTDNFKTWRGSDGHRTTHQRFAEFMEDNLSSIIDPDAATVMEVCKKVETNRRTKFASTTTLENGSISFSAEDTQSASVKDNGGVRVFDKFKIKVMPFEDGPEFEIIARLRWSIKDGNLELWYDLVKPDEVVRQAFDYFFKQIEKAAKITPFLGSAG